MAWPRIDQRLCPRGDSSVSHGRVREWQRAAVEGLSGQGERGPKVVRVRFRSFLPTHRPLPGPDPRCLGGADTRALGANPRLPEPSARRLLETSLTTTRCTRAPARCLVTSFWIGLPMDDLALGTRNFEVMRDLDHPCQSP
jgi:hypothetical protein